jgi:CDP-4-dehydro-6-deoxyglucose reductase
MSTVQLSNGKSFECPNDISVLDAAKNAGLVLEHSCRTGRCGSCKAELLSGSVVALRPDLALSAADKGRGWILTCAVAAASDIRVDIEDLGLPAEIVVHTLPCRIACLERASPDVLKVTLRLPPNTELRYLAGQYIEIIGKGGLRRSYSLASVPGRDAHLELHVRQVPGGAMSAFWFEQAKLNDLLRFEGPRGTFFLRGTAQRDLVFLATGTGIAPIQAMLRQLERLSSDAKPRSIRLLWGGRHAPDHYWTPQAGLLALDYTPVLSRGDAAWAGARGYVQDVLLASAGAWDSATVYACGSSAMIASARSALVTAGLSPKQFFSDAFVSASN